MCYLSPDKNRSKPPTSSFNTCNLSFDCDFRAMIAYEHRNQFILDSVIPTAKSNQIPQWLSEKEKLCLIYLWSGQTSAAFTEATHVALRDAAHVSLSISTNNRLVSDSSIDPYNKEHFLSATGNLCYFFGLGRHPRTKCPAKETLCKECEERAILSEPVQVPTWKNQYVLSG